jgi:AraC family transcriptional activator of pobA
MEKTETIEEFYSRKLIPVPENIHTEIGHFNILTLDPYCGPNAHPTPYKRRDYYKVMLALGHGRVQYADKVIEVEKQALVFSNPFVPYKWESLDTIDSGFFCIFDQPFFRQYGNLNHLPVFQPNNIPVFELNDDQTRSVINIFARMLEEINSDYVYKYDLLRTLLSELVHFATKMQPTPKVDRPQINASKRISTMFLELLERQFPIDDKHPKVALRSASDFASQLAVHVNHLNRAVKETTLKTTSEVIAERVLQEAKIMLRHSALTVSEVAYALGFNEVTNFNSFFKKHVQTSPAKFRNV